MFDDESSDTSEDEYDGLTLRDLVKQRDEEEEIRRLEEELQQLKNKKVARVKLHPLHIALLPGGDLYECVTLQFAHLFGTPPDSAPYTWNLSYLIGFAAGDSHIRGQFSRKNAWPMLRQLARTSQHVTNMRSILKNKIRAMATKAQREEKGEEEEKDDIK